MEEKAQPPANATLLIILIAALAQGWGLYGLHHSLDTRSWPATHSAWLLALYAVAIVGPLTVQMLVKHDPLICGRGVAASSWQLPSHPRHRPVASRQPRLRRWPQDGSD